MVAHPKHYRWSSFSYYAFGRPDPLITPAPSYLKLGVSEKERQYSYRMMVDDILRNDWKEKRPYSSVAYIGNPDWVKRKTHELKEFVKLQRTTWQDNFWKKFNLAYPNAS